MNGYVVFLRTTLDDNPLGLFATRAEAEHFLRSLTEAEAGRLVAKGFNLPADVHSFAVVAFESGEPADVRSVGEDDPLAPTPWPAGDCRPTGTPRRLEGATA